MLQGVELVDNEYFITEENVGMLKLAKEANAIVVCGTMFNLFIIFYIFSAINYQVPMLTDLGPTLLDQSYEYLAAP